MLLMIIKWWFYHHFRQLRLLGCFGDLLRNLAYIWIGIWWCLWQSRACGTGRTGASGAFKIRRLQFDLGWILFLAPLLQRALFLRQLNIAPVVFLTLLTECVILRSLLAWRLRRRAYLIELKVRLETTCICWSDIWCKRKQLVAFSVLTVPLYF